MRKVFRMLMYLKTRSPVGGTIWRDGATLLEEVCPKGQALGVHSPTPLPVDCSYFCVWMEIRSFGFRPSHLLPCLPTSMDSLLELYTRIFIL